MAAVSLRCFAAAREAAGRSSDEFVADTVGALLDAAVGRYGARFDSVLANSRIWLNGDDPPDGLRSLLGEGDEVAVLPPVSGG